MKNKENENFKITTLDLFVIAFISSIIGGTLIQSIFYTIGTLLIYTCIKAIIHNVKNNIELRKYYSKKYDKVVSDMSKEVNKSVIDEDKLLKLDNIKNEIKEKINKIK